MPGAERHLQTQIGCRTVAPLNHPFRSFEAKNPKRGGRHSRSGRYEAGGPNRSNEIDLPRSEKEISVVLAAVRNWHVGGFRQPNTALLAAKGLQAVRPPDLGVTLVNRNPLPQLGQRG